MTDLSVTVAGHVAKSLRLSVPNVGPWFLDAELVELAALTGRVEVLLAGLRLSGTVAPDNSGSFVQTSRVRIVGGANGWGTELAAKSYHNDGGVKARTVAEDATREAGETLGTFTVPGPASLGNDYVRRAGPAARALEDAARGTPWWVDYAGATIVGARPSVPANPTDYELLNYNASARLAFLTLDDPSKIVIGSVLSDDRLDTPQTVRELEFSLTGGTLRAIAWCGGGEVTEGRLVGIFVSLVERILARRLFGKYRYRVVSMAADGRVNLQAVSKAAGLPDVVPAMMRPGVAGMWADLSLGCEVLVEFITGAPTDPIVTAFPGRGEPGFVPSKITIGASTPGTAPPAARQGDTVRVLLPPATFTGSIGGSPATGVITFPTGYTLGTIDTGSGHVGIGS